MGVVDHLSLSRSGREVEWGGRLFEAGANLRLGAYSNKYGKRNLGKRSKRDAFTPGLNFLFSIFVSRATVSSALYRVLL